MNEEDKEILLIDGISCPILDKKVDHRREYPLGTIFKVLYKDQIRFYDCQKNKNDRNKLVNYNLIDKIVIRSERKDCASILYKDEYLWLIENGYK